MKQQIVISFLGKARQNQNYVQANYQLDQSIYQSTFFGFSLLKHIQPKKMVILGTQGSMWDVLIESQAGSDDELAHERLELIEACANDNASQSQLDKLSLLLQNKFNCEMVLQLIPYGRSTDEQLSIVEKLAQHIPENENITIDVTHGFRHLPMLGFMSAIYLQDAKAVTVSHIYSGALEMTDEQGITPVLNLTALLQLNRWSNALANYEQHNDYSQIAQLLNHNQHLAKILQGALFAERHNQSQQATQLLASNEAQLKETLFNHPISKLFADTLLKRLTWYKKPTRGKREQELAFQYLEKKDFMRAALYGFEAYITQQLEQQRLEVHNFDLRKAVSDENAKDNQYVKTLRSIRNALAHGIRPTERLISTINDANKLEETLTDCFKHIFSSKT